MNAAQEAVLMAIDGMTFERELPTPAMIGLTAQPPLTTAEVMVIAGGLIREGYAEAGDYDGTTYYRLTGRGDEYAQAVVARGT